MRARLRVSYPIAMGLNNREVFKPVRRPFRRYERSLSSVAIACAG